MATPIEEEGVRYVDVTDPNSGATFRFYDVEYSIACAMDGARDIEGLAEWTRAELGIETDVDELKSVVSTLAELGYLEAAEAGAEAAGTNGAGAEAVADGAEMELELGAPGGASAGGTEQPSFESLAPADDAGIELGEPGLAASTAGEDAPTREIELPEGTRRPQQQGSDESIPELGADALIEVEAPSPPAPPTEDEMSFAGLAGDDDGKAARTPAPAPVRRVMPSSEDDEPTQLPGAMVDDDDENVSVDLSAHLSLDRQEVTEAVRASKVMSIPEIPKDLLDEEARREAAGKAVAEAERQDAPQNDSASLASLSQAAASAMPLPPPPEVIKPPRVAAIPLPQSPPPSRPIEVTKAPAAAVSAPKPKKSSAPLILLLVLLVGGGAFVVWKFVLNKEEPGAKVTGSAPVKAQPPKQPDQQPPKQPDQQPPKQPDQQPKQPDQPAKQPVAKLTMDAAAATDLSATVDGVVEWTKPNGAKVVAGDPVVKLVGAREAEVKLADAESGLKRYTNKLAAAKANNDADAIAAAEAKLVEKNTWIAEANAAIAKFVIKSPSEGTVEVIKRAGQKAAAGEPLARVAGGAPALSATFDAGAAAADYQAGGACTVAPSGNAEQSTACVVEKVDGTKVTVRVVSGGAPLPVKDGDEVVLSPAKK